MSRSHPTRRQLGQAAVAALVAPHVLADDEKPKKKKTVSGLDASTEALLGVLEVRYGKVLDERQLEQARQNLRSGLAMADRLRKIHLANGDEPAFVFTA